MDPRQREERNAKQRHTQALLDKAYGEIISSQLERLSSKKSYTENDEDAYRLSLAADREQATKKRRKIISVEHEELARTTGLSGHVVALMVAGNHDDSDASRKRHHKRKSRRRNNDSDQDDSSGSEDNNNGRKYDREEKSRKKKDNKMRRKRD